MCRMSQLLALKDKVCDLEDFGSLENILFKEQIANLNLPEEISETFYTFRAV